MTFGIINQDLIGQRTTLIYNKTQCAKFCLKPSLIKRNFSKCVKSLIKWAALSNHEI